MFSTGYPAVLHFSQCRLSALMPACGCSSAERGLGGVYTGGNCGGWLVLPAAGMAVEIYKLCTF